LSKEKLRIQVEPNVMDKAISSAIENAPNKMLIQFPLLRTFPIVNSNGDSYDYDSTKEAYNSIDFGYINLEHNGWINIGTITSSSFEDEGNYGVIKCEGVLWKNALEEYDITEEDIRSGKFQISMEVFFNDYYVMHGNKKVERPAAAELVDKRGQLVEGEKVARVVIPTEYSGAALVENAADKTLDIEKIVAKQLENKQALEEETNTKEDKDMPYKQFETEEEFNEFLEAKRTEIVEDLKEDEEFMAEATEGLVSYNEVVAKFEEAGIEDVEDIETAIAKVTNLKEDFEEFKQEVARNKKLAERKDTIEENGIDLEKIEASDEDILEMSDRAFELMIKGYAQAKKEAQKAQASENDNDGNDNGFDPTNISDGKNKKDNKDIIKAL